MIWTLLGCTGGASVASVGDVEIRLAAPYDGDPFAGAETLRVVVRDASGAEVARGDGTPTAPPALAGIEALGLVEIEVTARDGETVLAAGRSGPVALGPGDDLAIDVLFLPTNRAVAGNQLPAEPRSEASSTMLADGRVLLFGGRSGGTVLDTTELWDPFDGFATGPVDLPGGGLELGTTSYGDHGFLVAGGRTALSGAETEMVFAVDAQGREQTLPDMAFPRAGFCLASLGGQSAVAMGGRGDTVPEDHAIEILRPVPSSTDLAWSPPYTLLGGDLANASDCTSTAAGQVVVLDRASPNWSVFDLAAPGITNIDDRHAIVLGPTPLEGAILMPVGEDGVLVVGGRDDLGRVEADSWLVDARAVQQDDGAIKLDTARAFARGRWLEEGKTLAIALGVGATNNDVETLEVLDVDGDALVAPIDLGVHDAVMEVLPGGAIAFLGGTSDGVVLVLPWFE